MLFHSSMRRELGKSFGATLLVLLSIVITMLLIRTLGLADRGRVNPEEILLVLTYTVIGRLPAILTLALFVAVVSTLSRMYRESEMTIWFSSGLSLTSFLKPVLRFAWPIIAVILLLVLLVWPWANAQTEMLRDRYERRGDLERVVPGQFQESSDGRRVFFIEKHMENGTEGRNIFISSLDDTGTQSIISAQSGRVEWVGDQQMLLLDQGQRLEFNPMLPHSGMRVGYFAHYGIRIGAATVPEGVAGGLKARPTWQLISQPSPTHSGELAWRLGLGLAAFNLTLLGVAVAAGNPRAGKGGNLLFALFAFIVYHNLLSLGQGWVITGVVGWLPFMIGLHGSVFGLCALWLAHKHYGWTLAFWKRPSATGASGAAA